MNLLYNFLVNYVIFVDIYSHRTACDFLSTCFLISIHCNLNLCILKLIDQMYRTRFFHTTNIPKNIFSGKCDESNFYAYKVHVLHHKCLHKIPVWWLHYTRRMYKLCLTGNLWKARQYFIWSTLRLKITLPGLSLIKLKLNWHWF